MTSCKLYKPLSNNRIPMASKERIYDYRPHKLFNFIDYTVNLNQYGQFNKLKQLLWVA